MTKIHVLLPLLPLLAAIACGPAGISADTTGTDGPGPDDTTLDSSGTTNPDPTGMSETSTDTSTDTGDSFPDFVPNHDGMETPSSCDPFAQDCPDGEKCVAYASTGGNWDASKCVPILGEQATGEPCISGGATEATDDCDATGMCWEVVEVDGELSGTCTAFCMGSPDAPECPPGSQCLINSEGSITLCIPTCDPLAQDCDPGHACYWANNAFNCIFTTTDIPAGEPCGFINDCAAGLSCLDASVLPDCAGAACCSPFCSIQLGDVQCEALPGTACVAFFEPVPDLPPGYEDIGVCILP